MRKSHRSISIREWKSWEVFAGIQTLFVQLYFAHQATNIPSGTRETKPNELIIGI